MAERILILGGTAEGTALAWRLNKEDPGAVVITSLAGRVDPPPDLPGEMRIGGFGGVAGLIAYLHDTAITRVVDATHPFATRISDHAARACAALNIPLRRLTRPMWRRRPGDRWHWAQDAAMAARMAPGLGRRILLTVGAGGIAPFLARSGPFYVVRLIAPPARHRRRVVMVAGRGPFSVDGEIALLRRHRIDLVVTKASGGAATEAKITAARHLGIPVLMIRRPETSPNPERVHVAG